MVTQTRRVLTVLGTTALLANGVSGVFTGTAFADPPGIPSESAARTMLGDLTVKADGSQDGYDREKFPHWSNQGDSCDTREAVLKRDGSGVETGTDCYPTSGSWTSPYDGGTWTQPSDIDIDHVVPLAEAWRSGAAGWTQAEREAFANDLDGPQLIAVTDNVNQSKGDQGPETWKPPTEGYWCTYSSMWIGVKDKYQLTVSDDEIAALTEMLNAC